MLRVESIKNVNSTLNRQPAFRAGVQTNYGVEVTSGKNIVENGLFTGFAGIIKDAFASRNPEVKARAKSIEAGLSAEIKKFDAIA